MSAGRIPALIKQAIERPNRGLERLDLIQRSRLNEDCCAASRRDRMCCGVRLVAGACGGGQLTSIGGDSGSSFAVANPGSDPGLDAFEQ